MLKTESYKKGIILSTGLNFFAKGIAFLNIVAITHFFGTQTSTDIYFFVLSVAMIISTTINGVDLLVLIPEAMKLRNRDGEAPSRNFLNFFFWLYIILGALLCIIILFSPVLFFNIFSKFDVEKLSHHKELLYAGSIIIFFQLINSFLTSVLTSYKYFSIAIFTSLLNSLLCILLTVTLHQKLGINGTMIGLAAGYALNFLLLVLIMRLKLNWNFFQVARMRNKVVWQNIGLMQVNIFPLWLRNYLGLYLLSALPGVVTSLNLGQQLSAVPEMLLTSQLLTVAGIKFNELHAAHKNDEANQVFLKTTFIGITITLSIAMFFILFSKSIVTLGYFKTITNEKSLLETTLVFSVLAISLPVKLVAGISTSMLTSFQKIKNIISVSAAVHIGVTIIMILLIKQLGLLGYLIGVNFHYFLFLLLFYPLFRRTLTFVDYKQVLIHFAKDLLLNGLCAAIMFFLLINPINGIDNLILRLLAGFVSYLVLFFSINHFLKLNDQANIKGIFNYVNNTIFRRKAEKGN